MENIRFKMMNNEKLIVVRGPSWNWNMQDGGEGNTGETICRIDEPLNCIAVRWSNGKIRSYRIGHQDIYDLRVFDNSLQGHKHNFPCNNCKIVKIIGMRYECKNCKDRINLCSKCYHSNNHNMRHSFYRYETIWSYPHPLMLRIYSKVVALHDNPFGKSYYPDHLPILGHKGNAYIALMSEPVPFPLRVGDRVQVHATLTEFRKSTKQPCTATMEQFNGEPGILHYITYAGDIAILYSCCNYVLTFKKSYIRYISRCSGDLENNQLFKDLVDEITALAVQASLRTAGECLVCSNISEKNVQFYPCNHTIACESCSAIMKKCMKCGVTIQKRYTADKTIIPYQKQVTLEERIKDLESKLSEDILEKHACSICVENKKSIAFMCGHSCCQKCLRNLTSCHMCRKPIFQSINFVQNFANNFWC